MHKRVNKKKTWLKRIVATVLVIIVLLAGVYWYVSTETFSDTKSRSADYSLNALDFIHEFQQNINAANEKYTDKIIVLNGRVSEIEPADTSVNIKIIEPATASYVIFSFQQQHLGEAKIVKQGDSISIKGSCSGGIYRSIL